MRQCAVKKGRRFYRAPCLLVSTDHRFPGQQSGVEHASAVAVAPTVIATVTAAQNSVVRIRFVLFMF